VHLALPLHTVATELDRCTGNAYLHDAYTIVTVHSYKSKHKLYSVDEQKMN
jgi:hypothetical protein